MEKINYWHHIAALLALNVLIANRLGWLFTEWKRPLLNFKPLNCRPCLTFWIQISIGAPLALGNRGTFAVDAAILLAVALSSLLNFYYIKSNITIHE